MFKKIKIISAAISILILASCSSSKPKAGQNKLGNIILLKKSSRYIPQWVGSVQSYWTNNSKIFFKTFTPGQTDITNGFKNAYTNWPQETKTYLARIQLENSKKITQEEPSEQLKTAIKSAFRAIPIAKIRSSFSISEKYWEINQTAADDSKQKYTIYLLIESPIKLYNEIMTNTLQTIQTTNQNIIKLLNSLKSTPLPIAD